MPVISPEIFRMYDIRGIYGKDLTENTALLIGKGLGTYIQEKGVVKIAVGRDNRTSGELIVKSFIEGLISTGVIVVYFDYVLNPHLYFSWFKMDSNATAVVTASHNSAEYNGFKISLNKKPLLGNDYQNILTICQNGDFKLGTGKLENREIWTAYKENILKTISLKRKLKIAIDCGNGTAGMFAPKILKDLGCDVIEIYCDSDGNFPNHTPYPQKVEYYSLLRKTIINKKCDAGLSLDGDGDRLGVYDEKGDYVEADRLAMIFIKDICQKNLNKKIVMNVSTSLSVIDFVKSIGGEFYFTKTGYPYVTEKMNEVDAIFGGEISGHFFFKDKYYGFDDALYAGIRLLEIVSNSEISLSELVNKLPRYSETREFRIEIPNGINKKELTDNIKRDIVSEYRDVEIIDIDGIRFSLNDSWGLIRASNTEPLLTGRAEGKTRQQLEEVKKIMREKLGKYGIILNWEEIK